MFTRTREPVYADRPDVDLLVNREYREETTQIIDGETRQLLEAAHARVRQTLAPDGA